MKKLEKKKEINDGKKMEIQKLTQEKDELKKEIKDFEEDRKNNLYQDYLQNGKRLSVNIYDSGLWENKHKMWANSVAEKVSRAFKANAFETKRNWMNKNLVHEWTSKKTVEQINSHELDYDWIIQND